MQNEKSISKKSNCHYGISDYDCGSRLSEFYRAKCIKRRESKVWKFDISDGDSLIKEKAESSQNAAEKNSDEVSEESQTAGSTETIGGAVLTQAQVSEYVAGARMEREQTHSKTKESLNEIINSDSVGESAKKEAVDKLAELADIMEKEAATEQLLASKGFENAVVSIGDDSVDVVLNYEELSSADRAQIEDIVTRKTGYSVSQLIISKMQTTES